MSNQNSLEDADVAPVDSRRLMALPIRPAVPNSPQGPTTVALNNYSDAQNIAHIQNIGTQNIFRDSNPTLETPIGKVNGKKIFEGCTA
jgi:hypothetical protein